MPGDPIDLMPTANPHITAADVARLKALHGLDQPLIERYRHWLAAALSGELRLFAPLRPAGARGPAAAPGQHLPPHGRRASLLALSIALPAGIAGGAPAGLACSTTASTSSRLRRHLDAALLARAASDLLFSVELGWLPASGMRDRSASTAWRPGGASRPARADPDPRSPSAACSASSAAPCSRRSARTTSAPPAPRARAPARRGPRPRAPQRHDPGRDRAGACISARCSPAP